MRKIFRQQPPRITKYGVFFKRMLPRYVSRQILSREKGGRRQGGGWGEADGPRQGEMEGAGVGVKMEGRRGSKEKGQGKRIMYWGSHRTPLNALPSLPPTPPPFLVCPPQPSRSPNATGPVQSATKRHKAQHKALYVFAQSATKRYSNDIKKKRFFNH